MDVRCPHCNCSMLVGGVAYVNGNAGTVYEVKYSCPVCRTIVYLRTPVYISDAEKELGK